MNLKITSIHIENFRALRELDIHGLGRVNLITGRNNAGKSSLLEALRILADEASPKSIFEIIAEREEDTGESEDERNTAEIEGIFPASSIFNGFPQLPDRVPKIVISTDGDFRSNRLTMEIAGLSDERDADGNREVFDQASRQFGDPEVETVIRTESNGAPRFLREAHLTRRYRAGRFFNRPPTTKGYLNPCIHVSPYSSQSTRDMEQNWSNILLDDYQQIVVDALKVIEPNISAVAMIRSEGAYSSRDRSHIAMVRAENFARRIPLRSYGDGLNRLFGIMLSLVNARSGILLVDEFENGLHWGAQLEAWKTIFELAGRLDTQVFATTHSQDAVRAFESAASATQEVGVLVRMVRRGDEAIPVVFSEPELAIVKRDNIEVR